MRTMPRNFPRSAPRYDYAADCDYCGARYLRSRLVRDAAGLLACPIDSRGRDRVTLQRANQSAAEDVAARYANVPPRDGGHIEKTTEVPPTLESVLR